MKKELLKSMKVCSLFTMALFVIIILIPSCQEETECHPFARFVLKGTVLSDPLNKPLPNILVIVSENRIVTISGKKDTILLPQASTITNEEGKFIFIDSMAAPAALTYTLKFVEGYLPLKATGHVKDTVVTCCFENPIFTNGDNHWYAGEFMKNQIFMLKTNSY